MTKVTEAPQHTTAHREMLISFADTTLNCFRRLGGTRTLVYGLRQVLEMDCVRGRGNTPVDVGGMGFTCWRLRVLEDLASPAAVLLERTWDTNIASSNRLCLDFPFTGKAAYKRLAGSSAVPVVLELTASRHVGGDPELLVRLPFTATAANPQGVPLPPGDGLAADALDALDRAQAMLREAEGKLEVAGSIEWQGM